MDSTYSAITRRELESFVDTTLEGTDKILIKYSKNVILTINLNVNKRADGTKLFSVSLEKSNNSLIEEQIEYIFDMSGMYDLEIEFLPGSQYKIESDNIFYFSKGKSVRKKMESFNAFEGWLWDIFDLLGLYQMHLIPDTNFMIRRYYSNFLKFALNNVKNSHKYENKRFDITLSKLTILELERQIIEISDQIDDVHPEAETASAMIKTISSDLDLLSKSIDEKNRTHIKDVSANIKKLDRIIEKTKPIVLISRYECKKRIRLQSLSEVLNMILDGALIMRSNDKDLVNSFDKAQGTHFADAWIRMEIINFRDYNGQLVRNVFFITSDLTNALTSVAENISTFYIHRKKEIESRQFTNNHIPSLIYNSAIVFGKCEVIFGTKTIEFVGMWEGKSPDEWRSDVLMHADSKNS